ncbi:GHKL domain-containing protein, partial [Erysipelatoclostridium ramosum]|uniref:sensor histidine kinase n=1 Tax=Thomasclavelia ramosa TaxID=1547 RepID=UPI001D016C03
TLSFDIKRFIMVFIINILTVIFIVVLDKLKIIPTQKVINRQVKLFIMLDILVYYAMVIIYNIGVVRLVNLITVLVLILLFLWIMFLKILSMYVETTIRNEELIMEDISNKYISKYLDFYNQESDNLRKLKHDLKNHQLVLESLDKKNQYTQYIDEVFKGIGQVAYIESGNIYIDACLYAKQQEYPEIIFDFDISVAGLVFNEKDLTSLKFNLIDNACNEALKHNKLVSVMIRYTNNLLIIRIKNTCPIKPNFSTDKGEGHGYGLKIIKNIVNKYHGDLFIDYHDDQVIFNIKINT